MTYGTYSGPDKPDKGKEGGSCNRTLCQAPNAIWYNHGSYSWYCHSCMLDLYDVWARRNWKVNFPERNHPQFETREQITEREAEK